MGPLMLYFVIRHACLTWKHGMQGISLLSNSMFLGHAIILGQADMMPVISLPLRTLNTC